MLNDQILEKMRARIVRSHRKRNNCPPPDEILAYAGGTLADEGKWQRVEQHLNHDRCLVCELHAEYGTDAEKEARGRANLRKLIKTVLAVLLSLAQRATRKKRKSKTPDLPYVSQAAVFGPAFALIAVCAAGIASGMVMIRTSDRNQQSRSAAAAYEATPSQLMAVSFFSTPAAVYRPPLWRSAALNLRASVTPSFAVKTNSAAGSVSKGAIRITIKKID